MIRFVEIFSSVVSAEVEMRILQNLVGDESPALEEIKNCIKAYKDYELNSNDCKHIMDVLDQFQITDSEFTNKSE